MSAVDQSQRAAMPARRPGLPTGVLCVRWRLSARALGQAGPISPEIAEAVNQWGSRAEPILEWTIQAPRSEGAPPAGTALLRGPSGVIPLMACNGTSTAVIQDDPESGTRHVEFREGGEVLLSAVFDQARGAALYARTSLLSRLGLPGGRYEIAHS